MAAPSHFSDPPAWTGLSPSSLRGEAVAYLASGLARVASLPGCVGAVWTGEGGRIERAPGLFPRPAASFSASPRLDAWRAALLGWAFSGRAPAAPGIPSGASPSAFAVRSGVGWRNESFPALPVPLSDPPGPPFPGWGRVLRVAASPREAAESGWLFPEESDSDPGPLPPFLDAGSASPALDCMAAFMASASEAQEPAGPDGGMSYALPEPPGGACPPPLLASRLSGAFDSRPGGDPAAMTRCWKVGASFALDPSRASSFTYWAASGSNRVVTHTGGPGVAGSGAVDLTRRWGLVRVSVPGAAWADLGATWAERYGYPEGVAPSPQPWLETAVLGVPVPVPGNTVQDHGEPSDWREVAMDFAPFEVAYAGAAPSGWAGDPADVPPVPRTGSGPLAASPAPLPSADDVAVQPVFTARVGLYESLYGDPAGCGADMDSLPEAYRDPGVEDDVPQRGSYGIMRCREWVVSGFVPGPPGRWTRAACSEAGSLDGDTGLLFASPADMRDFVESAVLPAVGVDPHALLTGSASWSYDPDGQVMSFTGGAVSDALLVVDVDLAAGCVFESGYCA